MTTTPAHPKQTARAHVLGVAVDCLDMKAVLALLESFVAKGTPHLVITADSSGIVQAQSDPDLKSLYERAALVTADSNGVLWAINRKRPCLKERVSGVDIGDRVCALSADKGYRIFFLGGAPGVAELAAEKMKLRYPGCNIVGARHGFFPAESDLIVAEEVAKSKPDFLFVGMGIPRQEKFIASTMEVIQAKVGIGVGGSFDVFSGKAKRAPKLVQKMKLEWLWRTVLNPKKISKAKLLPKFALMVLREKH
ncbi:MAG TPA: WecB/TagA/CpsF family glycosyltransferase [Fimbriimonas sp.]|nr:WecB/TagA/CpsF family glycosyltransferase [Fimbriimonas sp.]